jgi:hypothetical protein
LEEQILDRYVIDGYGEQYQTKARVLFQELLKEVIACSWMVYILWLVDRENSPLLASFYADASFSGQSMTHHPIYSTYFLNYVDQMHYGHYITDVYYFDDFITECLLNLHENERIKPRKLIPEGWIPVYDVSKDKRPKRGFDSISARKLRVYHQDGIEFLDAWAELTKDAVLLPWADGVTRSTRLFNCGVLAIRLQIHRA